MSRPARSYPVAAYVLDDRRQQVAAVLECRDLLGQGVQLALQGGGQPDSSGRLVRDHGPPVQEELQRLPDHARRQCGRQHAPDPGDAVHIRLVVHPVPGLGTPRRQQTLLLVVAQHPYRRPSPRAQLTYPHALTLTSMSGFSVLL
jgi:hypothetical protein